MPLGRHHREAPAGSASRRRGAHRSLPESCLDRLPRVRTRQAACRTVSRRSFSVDSGESPSLAHERRPAVARLARSISSRALAMAPLRKTTAKQAVATRATGDRSPFCHKHLDQPSPLTDVSRSLRTATRCSSDRCRAGDDRGRARYASASCRRTSRSARNASCSCSTLRRDSRSSPSSHR